MKSIGELMAESVPGWKPRPPNWSLTVDYARIEREDWEQKRDQIWAIMAANGVPEKHIRELRAGKRFDTDAMMAVADFMASGKMILLLTGNNYVGKSHALANAVSIRSVRLRTQFAGPQTEHMKKIGMAAEPDQFKRAWNSDFQWISAGMLTLLSNNFGDTEGQKLSAKLGTVGLLIIDEVGGGSSGPSFANVSKKLEDLISKREARDKLTMMTTNLNDQDLRMELGDRVVARLRSSGMVVECRGFGEASDTDVTQR